MAVIQLDRLFQELVTLDDIGPDEKDSAGGVPPKPDVANQDPNSDNERKAAIEDWETRSLPLVGSQESMEPKSPHIDNMTTRSTVETGVLNVSSHDPFLTRSLDPGMMRDATHILQEMDRPTELESPSTSPVSASASEAELSRYLSLLKQELPEMQDFFAKLPSLPAESSFFAPSFYSSMDDPSTGSLPSHVPGSLLVSEDAPWKRTQFSNTKETSQDVSTDAFLTDSMVDHRGSSLSTTNELLQQTEDELRLSAQVWGSGSQAESADAQLFNRVAKLKNSTGYGLTENDTPGTQSAFPRTSSSTQLSASDTEDGISSPLLSSSTDSYSQSDQESALSADSMSPVTHREIPYSDIGVPPTHFMKLATTNLLHSSVALLPDEESTVVSEVIHIPPGTVLEVHPASATGDLGTPPPPPDLRELLTLSQGYASASFDVSVAPENSTQAPCQPSPGCWICTEKGTRVCLDCDRDIFCQTCFTQYHYGPGADPELRDHRSASV
ncbi:hypothetical protein IWQ61_001366 [Dispira simplex]|nr:hypothetical protein IWQ61_001366 [Dispira simplex]